MPGELELQVTLNREAVNADTNPQLVYALIEAQPTGAQIQNAQVPLNLALVLDRSGSMSGAKIRSLREAVKRVVEQLQPTDFISIVLFDDQVEVPVYGQPAADKQRLLAIADTIEDRGGTQISLGLQKGIEEIFRNYDPGRINKIVLLTDGNSWGDEVQCQQYAQQAAQYNVPIVALGLGLPQPIAPTPGLPIPAGGLTDEWNHVLLDAIAKTSGGMSDLIDSPDKIVPMFQNVLRSAQATVIRNAELLLRLSADVTARQAWQVTPVISNVTSRAISQREVTLTLGDIEKNVGKSLVVELVAPTKPAGKTRIAQAEVTYDVPSAQLTGQKMRADVILEYGKEGAVNPRVMNLVEKVVAHKLQTQALADAQAGNVAGATQKLQAAATRLLELGETELAQAAQQEAQNLQQQGQMSAGGTKRLNYGTRKLTQPLPPSS